MVVFNRPINILCRVSLFLSMALCLLLRLFVFRLLRLKRFSTLTLKVLDRKSGSAGMPRPISYAVFCLEKKSGTAHGAGGPHQRQVADSRGDRRRPPPP